MWEEQFGPAILDGKHSWRAKKERLASEMATLCGEGGTVEDYNMDVDEPETTTEPTERVIEPFSDEWFADLDESIDAITNIFDELRVSQPEPEVNGKIMDAERGLSGMQDELMDCLAVLQNAKHNLRGSEGDGNDWKMSGHDGHYKRSRSQPFYATTPDIYKHDEAPGAPFTSIASRVSLAPGEKVMKQLFRWWQPCRPGCVRDAKRLEEGRTTEVDGRLIQ